jgi:hypothetical protein
MWNMITDPSFAETWDDLVLTGLMDRTPGAINSSSPTSKMFEHMLMTSAGQPDAIHDITGLAATVRTGHDIENVLKCMQDVWRL